MTPERWEKVGEIFSSASEMDTAEREAYLREACGADPTLLAEVRSLLDAGKDAGRFISEPVAGNFVSDFADHIKALAPGNSIGHYKIEKAIGSGGMGEVYLATDTVLGREVALKTLPPSFASDPSFLKRFRNEAQAAANINHPNVATVYSVEECDGIQFLTMEYIDGKTLDRLTPEGGLSIKTFLQWLEPIAHALSAAHKRGIIHRDIKPGNIMISADGTPKILDFGLAQIERSLAGDASLARDITAPGQIIGTPSYMSPEQAEGAVVDIRSDIFSFGTVMYEALTGKRPFRGASQGLIVRAVIHDQPDPIAKHRPDTPYILAKMVEKCLQKSPGKRFQSMREIRSILKEARSASDAGVSMNSFARRFYREATSPSRVWMLAVGLIAAVLLTSWWLLSNRTNDFPIRFENMTMRRFSDANNVGYAQITPDGKSVVYATFESEGTRSLWIRRIDDHNPLLLVQPQQDQYYWGGLAVSNDGGNVFYITAGRTAVYGTLYRVSSLGGPSRKLLETANDIGGISSDDSRLLIVRYGDPARIISVNTSDGGDEKVVLESPPNTGRTVSFRDPHFSSDGRSVFFIRVVNLDGAETWSIESVDLEDGRVRQIYSQPERISELAVLPNAGGIVFTGVDHDSKLQQIFYLPLNGASKTRVTNDLLFYFGVNVDKAGKMILASQRSSEQEILIGDPSATSALKPAVQEPNPNRTIAWAPDGRIVFDAYESNVSHIWIANADGTNRQRLTSSGTDDYDPEVSPDGRYIVFTSKRTGRAQVWRMEIDGARQTLLADVPGITALPAFMDDGQSVAFEWVNGNNRSVAKAPLLGGPVQEFLKPGELPMYTSFSWAVSPDGKSIAHSIWDKKDETMKIAVRPIDGNQPSVVLNIWPSVVFKWSPDGKSLIYRERKTGYLPENVILQASVLTGRSNTLYSTESAADIVLDLSYSRDEKKIAVMTGRTNSNAVLLTAASKP